MAVMPELSFACTNALPAPSRTVPLRKAASVSPLIVLADTEPAMEIAVVPPPGVPLPDVSVPEATAPAPPAASAKIWPVVNAFTRSTSHPPRCR